MILVLLFLVFCTAYYLYTKNHRYLSFGLGCLFFLWYGWYSSYSVFTFTHEPIIVTSTAPASSAPSINHPSLPQSLSKQQTIFDVYPNTTWPITISATQTNIQSTDIPLIILNKNRITVNSNMETSNARDWAQSLNSSGLWPDIDYTSGCSASMVKWQANIHLERIESMASVWYQQQQDNALLSKITQSLDYWFLYDFVENDCLMYGGRAYKHCPCGTPGLWNREWRYQGIDIPRQVGNICLLIYKRLSAIQQAQCIKFTSRSYSSINQHDGLNLVDMAYNGATLALLKGEPLLLQDALNHIDVLVTLATTYKDGIQMDGSYIAPDGQLSNGHDGEAYILDLLTMFDSMILESKTAWHPSNNTQTAFARLVSGSEWMIIGYNGNSSKSSNTNNTMRSPWLWQHSTLSQTTSNLNTVSRSVSMNITQMNDIIQHWSLSFDTSSNTTSATTSTNETVSPTALSLRSTIARLNHTYTSANQGPLVGTRYFWNAGYLVHRCHGFVTTLKMDLQRTTTSSGCNNGQETAGHLNYGSLFTYQQGTDYLDVVDDDVWDWNYVPGTTVRSNSSTSLWNCNSNGDDDGNGNGAGYAFVGATVLEQNQMGVAVMNFTDRQAGAGDDTVLGWQKTFFFFPALYAIQMDLTTTTGTTNASYALASSAGAAVTTTLDQRRRRGDIFLNGKRLQQPNGIHQDVQTLWHDKILYSFESPVNLTMTTSGNGSTSGSIYTASIETAATSLIYTVQPNYGTHRHQTKPPLEFISAHGVRGAFSAPDHALALAFWAPATINVPWSHSDDGDDGVDVFIETRDPLALFLQQQVGNGTWVASISDPTKSLVSTSIKISIDQEEAPIQYDIDFPQGQMRGSSVTFVLQDEP